MELASIGRIWYLFCAYYRVSRLGIQVFTLHTWQGVKQSVCLLLAPQSPVHAVCVIQRFGTITKRLQMAKKAPTSVPKGQI